MEKNNTISIKEYLTHKGIDFKEYGGELIAKCLFNDCDKDSSGSEAHLYFNSQTGQYECKKCGKNGNTFTLAKFLGDEVKDVMLNPTYKNSGKSKKFDANMVEACRQALPPRIRQYLNERGVTDAVLGQYNVGYGEFFGKSWICMGIKNEAGEYVFFKLREDPIYGTGKMTYPEKAGGAQIYDWEMLQKTTDRIIICEGELDRLALLSRDIPAVTSTHGATTFKQEWAEKFKNCKKIYICYDNDEPGVKGALRVATILENIGNEIYIVSVPKECGKDVTDFLTKFKGDPNDLFGKYAMAWSEFKKTERIKKIEKIEKEVSFEEWQNTIKENFPDLLFPAEIGLSIISQILITDVTNPFALVLVDVPSSGKTITINFFSEIEGLTYATDKFTPASFVSNATNVKKEELEKIDLLPRLKYKMFLLRDLSTLFAKRDDDLNECLGLLTRVLDGEGLNTDSGVHGQRQYVGEYLFMILAGSTPIQPRVWKMMGSLGSRLFFLNMGAKEKTREELANQITTLAHKKKENICRIATKNFLYTLWNKYPNGVNWDKLQDKQENKIIIAQCAQLLAKLRGVISVWRELDSEGNEYSYAPPIIEMPDRITQLFYNLSRGHALVHGRTQINQSDLKLIVELAIDSCSPIRAKLFRKLLDNNGALKTSDVAKALNCSRPTASKEMETLKILGVCNVFQESQGHVGEPEKTLSLSDDFNWFLSDECKRIRCTGENLPFQLVEKVN
jgi:hypothetical protein